MIIIFIILCVFSLHMGLIIVKKTHTYIFWFTMLLLLDIALTLLAYMFIHSVALVCWMLGTLFFILVMYLRAAKNRFSYTKEMHASIIGFTFLSIIITSFLYISTFHKANPYTVSFETFFQPTSKIALDFQEIYMPLRHFPFALEHITPFLTLFGFSLCALIILMSQLFVKTFKLPPLLLVLSESLVFICLFVFSLMLIHLSSGFTHIYTIKGHTAEYVSSNSLPPFFIVSLLFFLFSYVLFYTVKSEFKHYLTSHQTPTTKKQKLYLFIQYIGKKSAFLFVISLPILLVIQIILTLFHQVPSSWVQFFTQSSDWKFSQLHAPTPEIVVYDNHYLCTVASQGDKKRVKYTRYGVRSGRAIPLNRQLCVANAFENILEERFPKTHKVIRTIYDNTGFHLAQKIKTKKAAHIVYYAMKPLEYVFLFVLYLVDPKPEDRINMQYTGARYDKIPKQARVEAK